MGLGPFAQPLGSGTHSPRSNQVHLLPVDRPNPEHVSQKQPDSATFGRHTDFFDQAMNAESQQPPAQAKLPDWEYKMARSAAHGPAGGAYLLWAITQEGRYVGPIHQLLDELCAVRIPGRSDLIRAALRHSHWEGLRGGAQSTIVVENTLGSGMPKVVVDGVGLATVLNLDPETPGRMNYFTGLFKTLSVTA